MFELLYSCYVKKIFFVFYSSRIVLKLHIFHVTLGPAVKFLTDYTPEIDCTRCRQPTHVHISAQQLPEWFFFQEKVGVPFPSANEFSLLPLPICFRFLHRSMIVRISTRISNCFCIQRSCIRNTELAVKKGKNYNIHILFRK